MIPMPNSDFVVYQRWISVDVGVEVHDFRRRCNLCHFVPILAEGERGGYPLQAFHTNVVLMFV